MSNVKFIYSLKIHMQLQVLGFNPIREMKNPYNEKYKCWAYEATDEFQQAFDNILNDRGYYNG